MKRFLTLYRSELVTGAACGILMAFSFPPFPTRVLACVALVPLFRYFYRAPGMQGGSSKDAEAPERLLKRGFVLGYATGIFFFAILLYWISNLIPASSARMPWLMVPAVIILTLYLSLYPGLFALMLAFLGKRWGRIALAAAPALWTLTEFARSRGELGFSWGILSNALAIHPVAIQGLSLYGPFGLSFVIVLANLLLATLLCHGARRARGAAAAVLVLLVAGHILWGSGEMERVERERRDYGETVAVVQPNVDLAIKWKQEYRDSVFSQIDRLTREAAERGAGLVIFPETSAPISFRFSGFYRELLRAAAMRAEAELLVGHIDHEARDEEWRSFNSASLFEADGTMQATYSKVNLLPFGERIPFSQYIPLLGGLDFGQANFLPGDEATIFESGAGGVRRPDLLRVDLLPFRAGLRAERRRFPRQHHERRLVQQQAGRAAARGDSYPACGGEQGYALSLGEHRCFPRRRADRQGAEADRPRRTGDVPARGVQITPSTLLHEARPSPLHADDCGESRSSLPV